MAHKSTGLLLGTTDLIRAARLNAPPHSDAIGRGMKVNKEEMLGLMVAVELALKPEREAEWREWEKRVKVIADSLAPLKAVKTEMFVPDITYRVPHLRISWDEVGVKIAPPELVRRLREGEPSIRNAGRVQRIASRWASGCCSRAKPRPSGRRIREILQGAA